MAKSLGKKSPSRIRYEQANPTVSFRVSREIFDGLQSVKHQEGKSYSDIFKAGLKMYEVKVEKEEPIRQKAYEEGYWKGFDDGSIGAMAMYMVEYPCSECGQMIQIDTEEQTEAAAKYMQENGWGHSACHQKRR